MILRCEAIFCRAAASIRGFFRQQSLKRFARLLADRVAIFIEADCVDVGQSIGHGVGQLVELVAVDPHSTALYFLASSVFTFLNISAYCAPDLRISSEYASRITRTSSLMRSSSESSSSEALRDARLCAFQITGGDQLGIDEVLDRTAGEIPNVFARKNHGLNFRIPHRTG